MTAVGNGPRLDQPGTSESAWAGWQWHQLGGLSIGRHRRAVMVAPHPDDEVLAAGGLMQRLSTAGTHLTVISVTDGEGSHPRSPTVMPSALADRRARELHQALDFLGLRNVTRLRLALPDGDVAANVGELVDCLGDVLGPDVLCVAPWEHDGHPDHDATGRAAATAGAATGAAILTSLVWTWHWSAPGDDRVPWARACRLDLSRVERTRKRWAVRAFRSQTAPLSGRPGDEAILGPETLSYFDRPHEVFLS